MSWRTLVQPPNLVSLSRILLVPFIGYYLAQGDDHSTRVCVILLAVAVLTDLLDGYLARRLNQISRLGIALDPIADKILAAALVVLLVLYREFPLWLAGVIIGRDLLLLMAGLVLLKQKRIVVPANLTGKYTFVAIAVLLFSHVIRFEFGVRMMTPITVLLIGVSTIIYSLVFVRVRARGSVVGRPTDRPLMRGLRFLALFVLSAIYAYRLYLFIFQ